MNHLTRPAAVLLVLVVTGLPALAGSKPLKVLVLSTPEGEERAQGVGRLLTEHGWKTLVFPGGKDPGPLARRFQVVVLIGDGRSAGS